MILLVLSTYMINKDNNENALPLADMNELLIQLFVHK